MVLSCKNEVSTNYSHMFNYELHLTYNGLNVKFTSQLLLDVKG
jgi:hypothetical protein